MGVSVRYMIVAAAVAAFPGAAFAQCCRAPGASPPVSVPGPTMGGPVTHSAGVPSVGGGGSGGCAPRCAPGAPNGPQITVPGPYVPAPHITVAAPGSHAAQHAVIQMGVSGGAAWEGGFVLRGGGGAVGSISGVDGGQIMLGGQSEETTTQTEITQVAIQALCFDDRGTPHPASQTFADQGVPDGYDGEIYRCIAGTSMRVTLGRYVDGQGQFDGGRTFSCNRGEALVYRNGEVVCRTQEARRQCNERSLLRRFGPGIKVAQVRTTRTVQVERRAMTQFSAGPMGFSGGVGEGVW